MNYLTVRNLDEDLAKSLKKDARRRGKSMNATVLELLRVALGLDAAAPYENGLRKLAGTWSEREFEDFEENTAIFERIDNDLWR
jgi:plasmid stability protein